MGSAVREWWWRHRLPLTCAVVVLALLGALAAGGGFRRSERPVAAYPVGATVELGRWSFVVERSWVTDVDEDGEPFEDEPYRVHIDAVVQNRSDESARMATDLIGLRRDDGWYGWDIGSAGLLHPDMPRRLDLVVPVGEEALRSPGSIDVWLGAETFSWSNLINPGPDWGVPLWRAMVVEVPLSDRRTR